MSTLYISLTILVIMMTVFFGLHICNGYSALQDARLIAEYKRQLKIRNRPQNHALIARRMVHQAYWSAVGSISTDTRIAGYPMVNVISVADSTVNGTSTGDIYFLLTDLDFTGSDWKKTNKVTFFFSGEQTLNCSRNGIDPMEPTCPRAMISGQVQEVDKNDPEHASAAAAYISRHPRGINWMKTHAFYFCKLQIENIYVLDWYGGPHEVPVELYYRTSP